VNPLGLDEITKKKKKQGDDEGKISTKLTSLSGKVVILDTFEKAVSKSIIFKVDGKTCTFIGETCHFDGFLNFQ